MFAAGKNKQRPWVWYHEMSRRRAYMRTTKDKGSGWGTTNGKASDTFLFKDNKRGRSRRTTQMVLSSEGRVRGR